MAFALVALCAAVAGGCGRGDDQRAAANVTERFLQAVEADDGERACAQLSADTVEALAQDEDESCAQAARGLDLSASPVARTRVFGIAAKVDLADGDSAFLELTSRGWRVSAAGCTPGPDDQPYECEIEA
jgi:hypothetical protein